MKRLHLVTGIAALGATIAGTRQARADFELGGDFDVALPILQSTRVNYLGTGAGFDVRAGWRFRIPYQPLWITPEVAAGYTDLSANVVRVRPGLRVAFGNFVIPYVYAHFGFGWLSYDPLGVSAPVGTASYVSSPGYAFDTGAGVDFAVLRRLTVGAHLGYNMVGIGDVSTALPGFRADWINVGLNAAFHF
jgi:opacity protein-like surface antigen